MKTLSLQRFEFNGDNDNERTKNKITPNTVNPSMNKFFHEHSPSLCVIVVQVCVWYSFCESLQRFASFDWFRFFRMYCCCSFFLLSHTVSYSTVNSFTFAHLHGMCESQKKNKVHNTLTAPLQSIEWNMCDFHTAHGMYVIVWLSLSLFSAPLPIFTFSWSNSHTAKVRIV